MFRRKEVDYYIVFGTPKDNELEYEIEKGRLKLTGYVVNNTSNKFHQLTCFLQDKGCGIL